MTTRTQEQLRMLEDFAKEAGGLIGEALPKGAGFTLLVYDHGPGGWLTYVSNSKRADVLEMLAEFEQVLAANLESEPGTYVKPEPPVRPT